MNLTTPLQADIEAILGLELKDVGCKVYKLVDINEVAIALLALLTTTLNNCLPEKQVDNIGFTVGDGKLPLTQFQIGFNEAIEQTRDNLKEILGA